MKEIAGILYSHGWRLSVNHESADYWTKGDEQIEMTKYGFCNCFWSKGSSFDRGSRQDILQRHVLDAIEVTA